MPYTQYGSYGEDPNQQPSLYPDGQQPALQSPMAPSQPKPPPISGAVGPATLAYNAYNAAPAASSTAEAAYTLPNTLGINGPTMAPTGPLGNMGAALPWLGVAGIGAATASSAYNAFNKNKGQGFGSGVRNAITDGNPLNYVPVLGQARWAAAGLGGMLGHHDKDTFQRMNVKKALDASGLGRDLSWSTPSGNMLDMRNSSYNVDMSNPLAAQSIGYANPFAFAFANSLGMADDKFRKASTDLTGQIANTLMQGAKSADDVKNNILAFIQKMNIKPDEIRKSIQAMIDAKRISQQEGNAFLAAVTNLSSGTGPQDLSKPQVSPKNTPASVVPSKSPKGKPATMEKK